MATLKFAWDDGGRSKAFPDWPHGVGDCVIRGIAIYTGIPYKEVYEYMAPRQIAKWADINRERRAHGGRARHKIRDLSRGADYGVGKEIHGPYLMEHGCKIAWRAEKGQRGVTAQEAFNMFGDCLLRSKGSHGNHVVAIKGGKLRDTWNGLSNRGTRWDPTVRYTEIWVWEDHPMFTTGHAIQDIDGNYEDQPVPDHAKPWEDSEKHRQAAMTEKAKNLLLSKLSPEARAMFNA